MALSKQESSFMKTMQEIDIMYRAEMSRIREEGRAERDRENLEALPITRFGAIDPQLEQIIPKLLLLNWLDRVRQVMTMSREVLLEI
jgi:hypothetical protein